MIRRLPTVLATAAALALAAPALAQPAGPPAGPPPGAGGDRVTVGLAGFLSPDYTGSDDYEVRPIPFLQGRIRGIGILPRPAGIALNLLPEREGPHLVAGPVVTLESDRARDIKDPVVTRLGRLERAVEVGATIGVDLPGAVGRFGTLGFALDVQRDVAGAHGGWTLNPSVSLSSPLSQATFATLAVSATWADARYVDYYHAVSPAGALASGLPAFDPDGGGFTGAGINAILLHDLGGNLRDGGFSLLGLGGYSRMLGDAKASPLTRLRGSADQWRVALGLGYTF